MELVIRGGGRLVGEVQVPSDKSILHRALLFSAIAEGESRVRYRDMGADCRSTRAVLETLGVTIAAGNGKTNELRINGRGPAGLREPPSILDCGNSGTTIRLLLGVLAGRPFRSVLTGDDSLRRRPMKRVVEPLIAMGARIRGEDGGGRAPLEIMGGPLRAIRHDGTVASAQVKTAVLLAALQADGETRVSEPVLSRDHTERMLASMGAPIRVDGLSVHLAGPAQLRPLDIDVPGDPSSAAFFLGAAAMIPASEVTVRDVGLNPTRTGFLRVLERMGAAAVTSTPGGAGGEVAGSVTMRAATLRATEIIPVEVPGLIDELPLLAVVATRAAGITRVTGAAELRIKESDRIACLVSGLTRFGVDARELPDGFEIRGPASLRGARVSSQGDHRLAMAFAIAGIAAEGETVVEDAGAAGVSFPGFESILTALVRRP